MHNSPPIHHIQHPIPDTQHPIPDTPYPIPTSGLWYGLLGVLGFSLTLPATRVAVESLDPWLVGLGRPLIASIFAAMLLLLTRQPWPTRAQMRSLFLVAGAVILGFPLLAAFAMTQVPSAHGGIVLGILPLATAVAATWRAHERPSLRFWVASVIGSTSVVGFALSAGAGHLQWGDLLLLVAIAAGALGYAEGGQLARSLGGWQVICWALVLAAPFLLVPTLLLAFQSTLAAPPVAWLGFAYVTLISQLLAFFAWYRGLALGGIARVGQVQLLQPFFTLFAAAVLLGESITLLTIATACIVLVVVWLARKAPVIRQK